MQKNLISISFLFLGFAIGGFSAATILKQQQHTQVKVTTIGSVMDWNFRSNGTKDGDTFLIIQNGDTILSGVVVDGVWK